MFQAQFFLANIDNKKTEFSKKINEISSNILKERGLYKKCIKEINNIEQDTNDKMLDRRRKK